MKRRRAPGKILVNQSYAMQRVTGQQRYATEIADRLLEDRAFKAIRPPRAFATSAKRTWLWVLTLLPLRAGSSVVLSMTARAPLWQRRHVLVVHDLFVLTNPQWFSKMYYWTHAPLLRFQLRTASALVAVSQPVADELASFGVPVLVAPNAPSKVFTSGAAPAADEAMALASRGLVPGQFFLTVGSLDPRKNLPALARAYALLSDQERSEHPLVVVGGGSAVFRDEDIGWPEHVIDAGYVSDDDLQVLYRAAAAVVSVSLAEGFGLPLVEAAAAGTTCLVLSDIPVFRWVCGNAAHYVDPLDDGSIAAGLRSSITSPITQQVELDRFSWDASAQAVRSICTRIAIGG